MRSVAQGQQPGRSEVRFPNQAVWLPDYSLVSVKLDFLCVMWVRLESESLNHLPTCFNNRYFFPRLTVSTELFWIEQQSYFVLKEQVVVFCSPLFGDISLKVVCVSFRADSGCPRSLATLTGHVLPGPLGTLTGGNSTQSLIATAAYSCTDRKK